MRLVHALLFTSAIGCAGARTEDVNRPRSAAEVIPAPSTPRPTEPLNRPTEPLSRPVEPLNRPAEPLNRPVESRNRPAKVPSIDWIAGPGAVLMRTEVTVAQYRACVAQGACEIELTFAGCNFKVPGAAEHPINCISWSAARTFCAWVGGRLPTGPEWDAAATNGWTTKFPWGYEKPTAQHGHFMEYLFVTPYEPVKETAATRTTPVGGHPAGATKAGLQDMAGGVWEWTESESLGDKELRGGNGGEPDRYGAISFIGRSGPTVWKNNVGFRCAQAGFAP